MVTHNVQLFDIIDSLLLLALYSVTLVYLRRHASSSILAPPPPLPLAILYRYAMPRRYCDYRYSIHHMIKFIIIRHFRNDAFTLCEIIITMTNIRRNDGL